MPRAPLSAFSSSSRVSTFVQAAESTPSASPIAAASGAITTTGDRPAAIARKSAAEIDLSVDQKSTTGTNGISMPPCAGVGLGTGLAVGVELDGASVAVGLSVGEGGGAVAATAGAVDTAVRDAAGWGTDG